MRADDVDIPKKQIVFFLNPPRSLSPPPSPLPSSVPHPPHLLSHREESRPNASFAATNFSVARSTSASDAPAGSLSGCHRAAALRYARAAAASDAAPAGSSSSPSVRRSLTLCRRSSYPSSRSSRAFLRLASSSALVRSSSALLLLRASSHSGHGGCASAPHPHLAQWNITSGSFASDSRNAHSNPGHLAGPHPAHPRRFAPVTASRLVRVNATPPRRARRSRRRAAATRRRREDSARSRTAFSFANFTARRLNARGSKCEEAGCAQDAQSRGGF